MNVNMKTKHQTIKATKSHTVLTAVIVVLMISIAIDIYVNILVSL